MPPAVPPRLPPLPTRLERRPFGLGDDGRPIRGVTGASFEITFEHLKYCVGQRAAAELPPDLSAPERERRIAAAQTQALEQLVTRLNDAIADPRYAVTVDTLQRKGHRFSFEFSAYLAGVSLELSGDPLFLYHRLGRSTTDGPAPFHLLLRALPLGQAYRLFPSLAASLADTRLEVVEVGRTLAVVRWHALVHREQLPEALWPYFVHDSRGGLQGALALVPAAHSGLPLAQVAERLSCLEGSPYDEWVITWQAPGRRAWFGLGAAQPAEPPVAPLPAEAGLGPPPELPPLPAHLHGPAYGRRSTDPAERGLTHYDVQRILAHMAGCVRARAAAPGSAGKTEPAAETEARLAAAEQAAYQQLLDRLNAALPSPALTLADLQTAPDGHFSLEFGTFLQCYAAEIAGDPHFFFNRAAGSTYPRLEPLLRNFSVSQAYRILPSLTRLVSGLRLELISSTATSAMLRWQAAPQLARLPADLHPHFIHASCQGIAGGLSALPRLRSGLAPARIKEWQCQLRGDPYCVWEFTWQNPQPTPGLELWAGGLAALGLVALGWRQASALEIAALVLAPLPLAAGWIRYQTRIRRHTAERQAQLILEQREQAAQQYDELQRASGELQLANLALRDKVAELTSLYAVGQAVSANLGLEELLDRSLQAILSHLHFDRALVLLVDSEQQHLAGGRLAGGTPEIATASAQAVIPLASDSPIAAIARTGQPMTVSAATAHTDPRLQAAMQQFGSPAFIGVPMQVGGRVVGVLLADNAVTGRPLPSDSASLLLNVGSQIASALDRTRVYQTLEARVEQRTAEARESEARARDLLERERRHTQELNLLDRVRAALAQELELSAFFRTVVDAVAGTFGYRLVSLFMIDGERLVLQALAGPPLTHSQLPITQGIVGLVARLGEPVLAPEVRRHPAYWPAAEAIESEVCVPLKDNGQTVGVLDVETSSGVRLGEADLQLMLQLAEAVSLALRNARLYAHLQAELRERQQAEAAAQRRAEELEALHATLTDLSAELSLSRLLQSILRRAIQLVRADSGELGLYVEARQTIRVVASHNLDRDYVGTELALGEGAMGRVAQTREPLTVADYAAWAGRSSQYGQLPPRAAFFLPLLSGQTLRGVIAIGDQNTQRAFTAEDLRLVSLFAQQAVVAIQNAELYEQALHAAERRTSLYRASQEIAASTSAEQICEALHRAANQVMPVESVVVARLLDDGTTIDDDYLFDAGQRWPGGRRSVQDPSLAGYVIRSGLSLRTENINDPAVEAQTGAVTFGEPEARPCAALAVPMRRGETVLGMISVQSYAPTVYSADDQELLETLAAYAATAFENARLLEAARQRAQEAETLRQAGHLVTATLSQQEVVARILQELARVVPHDSASVQLLRDDGLEVVGGHGWGSSTGQILGVRFPVPGPNPNTVVIETRQPIILADAQTASLFAQVAGIDHIRGWLGVPLIARDRVIGMIALDSRQPNYFTPRHAELVEAFATQVAVAIENTRLYAQAALAAERRASLYRASREISAAIHPEQICTAIHRAVAAVMPLDFIAISVLTTDRSEQEVLYAVDGAVRDPYERRPANAGLLGHVIGAGQSLLKIDYDETELVTAYGASLSGTPAKSLLAAPIQSGPVVIGALTVQSDLLRAYTPDDLELLELLASQAATAFENARRFAAERRAAERREALLHASQEISASVDQEAICSAIHRAAAQVMPAEVIVIGLLAQDGQTVEVVYLVDQGERSERLRRPADQGMLGYVLANEQVLFYPDYTPELRQVIGGQPYGGPDPRLVRSLMTLPMRAGMTLVGVLSIQSYSPLAYTAEDLELLKLLAAQAAIAFENARLFEQTRRAAERRATLYQGSQEINAAADREAVCQAVERAAAQIMPVDFTVIGLLTADQGALDIVYAVNPEGRVPPPMRRPRDSGVLGTAVRTGQPLRLDEFDELALGRLNSLQLGQHLPRSILAVPMRAADAPIGALSVQSLKPHAYTEDDVELLQLLAAQAATAFENVRLLEEAQRAQQAAEAANAAKTTFLANISHEIRTPLNGVVGMTSLLLETPLTGRQSEFVETIRASGETLLALINDLLDLSKIESGKLELEAQPFELRGCVESALDLVAARAAEKGLELASLIEPGLPGWVVGDETRLRQILVNLLSNGVKFTARGEVTVQVTAQGYGVQLDDADPAFTLHFAVQDTGPGIAPTQQGLLFRSFSQLDPSVSRRFGGTGLGLAICRSLAEQMGGRIWVESAGRPDEGSTFHFTIQVREAEAPPAEAEPEPAFLGRRLLVAEAHALTRRSLEWLARTWGLRPLLAGSPAEALAHLAAEPPPDVIVAEAGLAAELEPALAAAAPRRQPPLVALSRLDRRPAAPLTTRALAVISKPVKAAALRDALREALTGQPTARPAPAASPARPLAHLRLLVAEDNEINRRLVLLMLERLGQRADVAANGLEVLEALRRQPYDLILMDVQMPELDGLETTRRIRIEFPASAQPVIVAVTANAMASDRQNCLAAGMDDYLSKPIELRDLQAALQRQGLLTSRGAAELPGAQTAPPAPAGLHKLSHLQAELGVEAVAEIMEGYLARVPELIAEMEAAWAAGHAGELAAVAHRLKGSSANLGLEHLQLLATRLEDAAQGNTLTAVADLLAQVRPALERLKASLAHADPHSRNGQRLAEDGDGPSHLEVPPGGRRGEDLPQMPQH